MNINFGKLNVHALTNFIAAVGPFLATMLPLSERIVLAGILSTLTGVLSALDTVVTPNSTGGAPAPISPPAQKVSQ